MKIYHNENAANLITPDHHLTKGSRVITLDKLTSTEIYFILVLRVQNKPCSNIYFENLFNDYILTGPQFICYHAWLRIIPICQNFNMKS